MLFVSLLKRRQGTSQQGAALRMKWRPPHEVTPVAEYWLQSSSVDVVYVFETDSPDALLEMRTYWAELYDVETTPAVPGERGLALLQRVAQSS
jgi:hypothetical protein